MWARRGSAALSVFALALTAIAALVVQSHWYGARIFSARQPFFCRLRLHSFARIQALLVAEYVVASGGVFASAVLLEPFWPCRLTSLLQVIGPGSARQAGPLHQQLPEQK